VLIAAPQSELWLILSRHTMRELNKQISSTSSIIV